MQLRGGGDQARTRALYDAYMSSPAWYQRRMAWIRRQPDPQQIRCVICHKLWSSRDDLHHITYVRLGNEQYADLVPVHRACHEMIHALLRTRVYRRLERRTANEMILARFRRQQ